MDHFLVSEDGLQESSVHPTMVASAASGPCRTVLQLSWQATIGSVNILRSSSPCPLIGYFDAKKHITSCKQWERRSPLEWVLPAAGGSNQERPLLGKS